MQRLFIAEKPSVAEDVANYLGITSKTGGYFTCGDDVVANCIGHLFEMAMPEHYDASYKNWVFEALPIVPDRWPLLPKQQHTSRIQMLGRLLHQAQSVVHVGDPDNEGQLLVDEVLQHFNYRGPVQRFWCQSQDSISFAAAFKSLRPNSDFIGMRDSALARGRADWLIGMNLSRAYTLRARAFGHSAVVSVGRVQTPTLELVASRDRLIANFRPIPFHRIHITVDHPTSGAFALDWMPREDQMGLDEEGRLTDTRVANDLVNQLRGAIATVSKFDVIPKLKQPPHAFSLASIGLVASNMYGITAAQTLEICQSLYEKHKLTTYPRVDTEYLPENQFGAAPDILSAIRDNIPAIAAFIDAADTNIKSPTWDDSKVTAHHGIIPTAMRADLSTLNELELGLYQLVVQRYVAQFYPPCSYDSMSVTATACGETFGARGKRITDPGWTQLFGAVEDADDDEGKDALPVVSEGDELPVIDAIRLDKQTTKPKRFTEGTLPIVMEKIAKYIDDPADRAVLNEKDGIGTPATRGAIIEELKRRGFLVNEGKYIVSTPEGRAVLELLPAPVKSASLTAHFQRQLNEIERGQRTIDQFVSDQIAFVSELVQAAGSGLPERPRHECPGCGRGQLERRTLKHGAGHFWSCSAWREGCKFTADDSDGAPDLAAAAARHAQPEGPSIPCPSCTQPLRRVARRGTAGYFWGCSAWKEGCRFTADDANGKPVVPEAT